MKNTELIKDNIVKGLAFINLVSNKSKDLHLEYSKLVEEMRPRASELKENDESYLRLADINFLLGAYMNEMSVRCYKVVSQYETLISLAPEITFDQETTSQIDSLKTIMPINLAEEKGEVVIVNKDMQEMLDRVKLENSTENFNIFKQSLLE